MTPDEKNKLIEELTEKRAALDLEILKLTCPYPVGYPVSIFDKWKRVGTVDSFDVRDGKAIVVLKLYNKDMNPYLYFVYNQYELKPA